jgi:hypothetical protein
MSENSTELSRPLVTGRKSDGRAVYDRQAKRELIRDLSAIRNRSVDGVMALLRPVSKLCRSERSGLAAKFSFHSRGVRYGPRRPGVVRRVAGHG